MTAPMNLVVVSAAALAILVVTYGVTFLIGRRIGRYNVVDATWGVGFVAVAAVAALLGTGDVFRRLLLLALVAVWGLRLAWHMIGKSAGKGEDPRYDSLLKGDFSAVNVLRKIFLLQAAAAWFISLPIQLSATLGPTPTALLPVLVAGIAVWMVGVLFETVGDYQLRQFKADPANKGVIMDRGPVGVDAPPQLLRRRRRVVGALAGHHRRLVVGVDGVVAGPDVVLPGVRHRGSTHREDHGRPSRIF